MHSMLSPQPSSLTITPLALVVVAFEPSVMRLCVLTVFTVVVPRVVHGAAWVWARVLVLRTTQADMLSHVVTLVVTLLVVTVHSVVVPVTPVVIRATTVAVAVAIAALVAIGVARL